MDTTRRPKKRDPERNKVNQKQYRRLLKASIDGIERERAQNRRRYHERITSMKETGEYGVFKAKKAAEGLQRYHNLPQEKRDEIRRKNRILNKAWIERMKAEGKYKAYKQKLNTRRREKVSEKRRVMGEERGKPSRNRSILNAWRPSSVNGGIGWTESWHVPSRSSGCR